LVELIDTRANHGQLDYIRPVVHAADDGKSLERSLELSAWNAIQTIKGDGVVHDLLGKNPIWTLRPQHRERSTEMDQYLWSFRFSLQRDHGRWEDLPWAAALDEDNW
jgi:hypothetical protein